jgi:hypothetical protein
LLVGKSPSTLLNHKAIRYETTLEPEEIEPEEVEKFEQSAAGEV